MVTIQSATTPQQLRKLTPIVLEFVENVLKLEQASLTEIRAAVAADLTTGDRFTREYVHELLAVLERITDRLVANERCLCELRDTYIRIETAVD